jgi:hypothetical protein
MVFFSNRVFVAILFSVHRHLKFANLKNVNQGTGAWYKNFCYVHDPQV